MARQPSCESDILPDRSHLSVERATLMVQNNRSSLGLTRITLFILQILACLPKFLCNYSTTHGIAVDKFRQESPVS